MRKVVAILEVMWDWEARTSGAGYEQAPPFFSINPRNFTGSRLYDWLGPRGEYFDRLLCTEACPQLVSSARGRGTPDPVWLSTNLRDLLPFSLLLVCGRVAQQTYNQRWIPAGTRIVEVPHPAARGWTKLALAGAGRLIREGHHDLSLWLERGKLRATLLFPNGRT